MNIPKDILILEDMAVHQRTLKRALAEVFPAASVSVVDNLPGALNLIETNEFDLALVDFELKNEGRGLDFIKSVCGKNAPTICVVYTVFDGDEILFECLKEGAKGYLLKEMGKIELKRELQKILNGDPPLSPSIAKKIISHFSKGKDLGKAGESESGRKKNGLKERSKGAGGHAVRVNAEGSRLSGFTERETEVLLLIAQGFTVKEVGIELEISPHTSSAHVRNIYRKLKVHSRYEAIVKATRLGLVLIE